MLLKKREKEKQIKLIIFGVFSECSAGIERCMGKRKKEEKNLFIYL